MSCEIAPPPPKDELDFEKETKDKKTAHKYKIEDDNHRSKVVVTGNGDEGIKKANSGMEPDL